MFACAVLLTCLLGADVANAQSNNNANLSSLALQSGGNAISLSPTFSASVTSYTAVAPSGATQVTVIATPARTAATFEFLDDSNNAHTDQSSTLPGLQLNIVGGDNVVKVKVTAEDGVTTKTYTVTIQGPSTNANLASLALQSGGDAISLSPTFTASVTSYTAVAPSGATQVTVIATPARTAATFEFLDEAGNTPTDQSSTLPGLQLNIVGGDNVVKVKVTAEDGVTTKTYTVTIQGPSTNANLTSLSLQSGGNAISLSPTFTASVTSYTAVAPSSATQVTVIATPARAAATFEFLDDAGNTPTDQSSSLPGLQLNIGGDNVVKVKVTAEDGVTTKTYTLTIRRLENDATLRPPTVNEDGSLTIWEAELTAKSFMIGTKTCIGYQAGDSGAGSLSPVTFNHGGNSWTVQQVCQAPGATFSMQFTSGSATSATLVDDNLSFHFGSTTFSTLTDTDNTAGNTGFQILSSGLTVTANSTYTLKFTVDQPPSAPRNLRAQGVSPTTIDLSWDAPSKTGGGTNTDITGYKIEVSSNGVSGWTDVIADTSSTDTTYSDHGLTASTMRYYRVSAINAVGTGSASGKALGTTRSIATSTYTATENDDGSLTIWEAQMTAGSFVPSTDTCIGYRVGTEGAGSLSPQSFTYGGNTWTVQQVCQIASSTFSMQFTSGSATSATLVDDNLSFHFDATTFSTLTDADNTAGNTGFQITSSGLTPTAGTAYTLRFTTKRPPSAPRNLRTKGGSATEIILDWRAPSKTGGSALTGYKIEVSNDGNTGWTELEASYTSGTYRHTVMSGATRYYRVSAINGAGTSVASEVVGGTAQDDAPGLSSADLGGVSGDHNDLVHLIFNEDINDNIMPDTSAFTVKIEGTVRTLDRIAILGPGVQLWLDSPFRPGEVGTVSYTKPRTNPLQDAAGNEIASFKDFPGDNYLDPIAPDSPTNLHAKGVSTTQIDLSWNAPEYNGGAPIMGYTIEASTDRGLTWTEIVASQPSTRYSHTVPSGESRYYRVSAFNTAGTSDPSRTASAEAADTGPQVTHASAIGTFVDLFLDEPVEESSKPARSAFTVNVGPNARTPLGVTFVNQSPPAQSSVVLTLEDAVKAGERVTVSYTKPTTNPLQDAAGNETESFTDFRVENLGATDFPAVTVLDEETHESGDGTPATMTFTVSVDKVPDFPVGVHFKTEDITTMGGASECPADSPHDYITTSGRVYFGPEELRHWVPSEARFDERSHEITVTICDDNVQDSDETFRLELRSTQLHEPIGALEGRVGPDGLSYGDEVTASATGKILNSETTTVVSIEATTDYAEEGAAATFTLRRTGDADEALSVPVSVSEDGATLAATVPEDATFAAGSREATLEVPTEDDTAHENDGTVTATIAGGYGWRVTEGTRSATVTVLDNDAAPAASTSTVGVTVWSADMTVVDYQNGNIGAGSADLLANQGGTAGLQAKWLYHVTGERKLKIAFDDGLDDAESMTLHVGDLSVAFPENSGGDSSFTIGDVDVSWTDGETFAARVSKPGENAVSTDATLASLTVSGATLSPAFDAGTLVYRAAVDAEAATVAASATDDGAAVTYGSAEDADAELADYQVAVPATGDALVDVTVTAEDGSTVRRYRVLVARAAGETTNTAPTGLPAISGTAEVGATLTASADDIDDADGIENATFAYQWRANGAAIDGATGTTYEVRPGDVGKTLDVRVTFTDDGGTAETLDSAATEAVVDNRPTLSISDASGTEGDDAIAFSVALDGAATGTVTVDYATADGTADGDDYTATSGTLTFAAGDTEKTVSVPIADDAVNEDDETFTVTLSNASGAALGTASATGTIENRGVTPSLSISGGGGTEGDDDAIAFTVALDKAAAGPVTVDYATADGSATAGDDYTATNGTLTFAAGETEKVVSVVIADDDVNESDETFTVTVSNPSGATLGTSSATGTIENRQEAALTASFESVPATHDGSGGFAFRVAFSEDVGISYVSMRDDAFEVDEGDVTGARRVDGRNDLWEITVKPDGSADVAVTLPGDRACGTTGAVCTRGEDPRPLSNSPSATVAGPTVAVTPTVGIADAGGTEGDDDAIAFAVTLDGAATGTVTVDYATSNGTADDDDYTATNGTLTFDAGTTSGTILVPIADDEVNEGDETFTVTLSNASGATLGTASATGTIKNRGVTPTVSISGGSGTEGDDDAIAFTVTLDRAATGTVTVDYATSNGTADGDDYTATSGTVSFAAGDTEKTVSVAISDDDVNESDETFTVTLSNASGADLGTSTATGTIRNRYITPTASIAGGSGTEGDDDAIAFTVTLDRTATAAVTVDYATSDGTATAGDDYTATSGTLTFGAGDTERTVSVPIGDDVENEDDETFAVTLSNASGAALGTASATGTIENRHVVPLTASFEQVPAEHDGTTFVFHVRFSEDPAVSYSVLRDESFGVTGGEVDKARRKDGRDDLREIHVEPSGHGDVTVSLPPTTDCDADGAICTADGRPLSNANAATVRAMPALSVADATATEGAGATLDFAVTLSRAASGPVTVAYATADGTAVAGSDYTAVSDTLSFAAGETSKTVQVALLDDSVDDDGETLTLTLSNPSGARLADATATGTIDNSDPLPQAWLVRFGRTAADHAIDAIGVRFEGGGETAHATFAGRRLWGGAPGADPLDADNDPFGLGTGIGSGSGDDASPYARRPGTHGAQPGMGMNAGSGMGMNGMSAGAGMNAGGPGAGMGTGMGIAGPPAMGGHRPALRDLLIGSSFLLSASGTDDAGGGRQLTAWGRASATRFDGAEDDVRLDGDIATFLIGADAAWDRWLAGISVAHSIGSGGFSGGADEGELDSTLTAVHPYVRVQATDRLSAWGVLGYGAGSLGIETGDSAWRTDSSMSMAAAGLRGVLLSTDAGLELAAKTDVRFTHIGSDEAVGDAGLLGETSGGTSRVRLLLEGTRPFAFGPTRQLTPSLQLGVRRDGGDAESGTGFDLGGTLRYADAALGLSVEASGRYLLAHEDSAYREWGASASIRVDPGIPGRGLTLSVVPSWGADASGGAERLWSARDARGLAGYGFDTDMRLAAQVGYGFAAFKGKGSMTPFAALSSSGPSGRELRAGALWARGQSLQMSLAGTRREAAGERPAHGVEFRLTWRPGAREGYPGTAGGGFGMDAPCPADGMRPAESDGDAGTGLQTAEAAPAACAPAPNLRNGE